MRLCICTGSPEPFLLAYSKTCGKWPLSKRPKIGFQDRLSLNAGQKYCRMLHGEHSAILSTFIKLPFVIRSLFCLFLSGLFTQVLVYVINTKISCAVSLAYHMKNKRLT